MAAPAAERALRLRSAAYCRENVAGRDVLFIERCASRSFHDAVGCELMLKFDKQLV
jgi:hypothetical protein